MKRHEIVDYWINSADKDFEAMNTLFDNGHFTWSLFVGHLVIEKLLKAYYVKAVGPDTPKTYNLLRIAELTGIPLSDDIKDVLLEITAFNLKTRCSDYKMRFYKKATIDFTEKYINKIKELREWLLERLKS